jgi:GTP-binding protein
MDIRHPLTSLDETMLAWFRPTGKPVHVLLTKADKLSRGPAEAALRSVRKRLTELAPNFTVQLFSALKRTGIERAEEALGGWLEITPTGADSPGESMVHEARGRNKKAPSRVYEARGRNKKAPS